MVAAAASPPPACEVWFYHLERASPEAVLADLLEKTLARGWKARIQCASPERMEEIDRRLWADRPEAFLPHGMEDEADAERQPILLGLTDENPNGAHALFLMDGAEAPPLEGYARCIDLFDGGDPAQVQAARERWRAVKATGLPMSYWRQSEAGRWEKQA